MLEVEKEKSTKNAQELDMLNKVVAERMRLEKLFTTSAVRNQEASNKLLEEVEHKIKVQEPLEKEDLEKLALHSKNTSLNRKTALPHEQKQQVNIENHNHNVQMTIEEKKERIASFKKRFLGND